MAHELDFTKGFAAIALKGGKQTAWHGYGNEILPGDSLETIAEKGGLDYSVLKRDAGYIDDNGKFVRGDNMQFTVRSDTGAVLGQVSENKYNVVQPSEVLEFFKDFLSDNKLEMETVGALRGGRIVWALAKLGPDYDYIAKGNDKTINYVRLQTSFDGSLTTDLTPTSIRQVCANTMGWINRQSNHFRTKHSQQFDSRALQSAFGLLGEQYMMEVDTWNALQEVIVSDAEVLEFFCTLQGIDHTQWNAVDKDGKNVISTRQRNIVKNLAQCYVNGPGAELPSSKGTAYGMLQAVTRYVDHEASTRDVNGDGQKLARVASAWFGNGERVKAKAVDLLKEKYLVAA